MGKFAGFRFVSEMSGNTEVSFICSLFSVHLRDFLDARSHQIDLIQKNAGPFLDKIMRMERKEDS